MEDKGIIRYPLVGILAATIALGGIIYVDIYSVLGALLIIFGICLMFYGIFE